MRREVRGIFGNRSAYGSIDPDSTGVLVCTMEKANQIITRLLEEDSIALLSCIVVDELHMVSHTQHL